MCTALCGNRHPLFVSDGSAGRSHVGWLEKALQLSLPINMYRFVTPLVNNAGFKRALEIYNEIPCMGHLAQAGNFIDLHTEEQFLNSRYSKKAIAVIMR